MHATDIIGYATLMPLFHRAHYNILAAQVRDRLDKALKFHDPKFSSIQDTKDEHKGRYYAVEALVTLALSLAKRLKEDNPRFDPLKFLDACSPDTDLYPLSELWEEDEQLGE